METLLGLAAGVPLAIFAGRLLESQLFEVKGINAPSLLVACGVMALSAVVASIVPARRAASVDPMQALRTE